MSSRDVALRLLEAEDEGEVAEIVEAIEDKTNYEWEPLGESNNYGVVESQASSPVASLSELTVNSVDSILQMRYQEEFGEEYNQSTGIYTYKDAEEALLDDDFDPRIEVVADGTKNENPNLMVIDNGKGQPPGKFEDTFLDLLLAGKRKHGWPFLQGQFGMGASAVLPHSGERGFKLILSAGIENPGTWSWTIIQKNKPEYTYEYLKIDGEIPTFEGEVRNLEHGAIVKVYDYKLSPRYPKTHITSDLRKYFDRVIWESPIPITLTEERDYKSDTMSISTEGGKARIERDSHLIDDRWWINHDFGDELGERKIEIYLFKDNKTLEEEGINPGTKSRYVGTKMGRLGAVFFTVNGQTHASLSRSFLVNRCSRPRTGKDMLVFVDFSDIGRKSELNWQLTDLFKPSRDQLTDKPLAKKLRDELQDAIMKDEQLDEEEKRRKQRLVTEKHEDKIDDILSSVVEQNPSVRRWLATGDKPTVIGPEEDTEEFDPPFFPSMFEIIKKKHSDGKIELWDESKGIFTKNMPVNRNSRIRFQLDAPNDYFDRDKEPGDLKIIPYDIIKQWNLTKGILSVELQPLPGSEPGDSLPVTAEVTRAYDESLEQKFKIEYVEPVESKEKQERETEREKHDQDEPRAANLDLPEPNPIHEDQWNEFEPPWDEHSIVELESEGEGIEDLEIYVNMDAAPLKHYIARNNISNEGKQWVNKVWKAGITLYSLGQYIELQTDSKYKENGVVPEDIVSVTMRGVAQTMLDQHISEEDIEQFTV